MHFECGSFKQEDRERQSANAYLKTRPGTTSKDW
jgi:hypothetical protein